MTVLTGSSERWPPVPVAGPFDLRPPSGSGTAGDRAFVEGEVLAIARAWCADRALGPGIVAAVTDLVREALSCGCRSGAAEVSMTIRWIDLDRMRIELVWHDAVASAMTQDGEQRASTDEFDRLTDRWGVRPTGASESCHWFDVDTRPRVEPARRHGG